MRRTIVARLFGHGTDKDQSAEAGLPSPDLQSLLPFAQAFARPDFTFGTWKRGQIREGVTQVPFFARSPAADALISAAYHEH